MLCRQECRRYESGSEQSFCTIRRGEAGGKAETRGQRSERRGKGQSTLPTGRVVRALENRTGPSTLSVGVGLIQRTPGMVVSMAFLAFPASVCNGWARLWGLAQGRESRRRKTCEPSALTRAALSTAGRAKSKFLLSPWTVCRIMSRRETLISAQPP